MKLNHVLLVIRLVEILAFHFLVKIIIGNTLENWDISFEPYALSPRILDPPKKSL